MTDPTVSSRHRKMARETKNDTTTLPVLETLNRSDASANSPTAAKPQSKASMVLELLCHPEGATLDQLVTATGWLPHSARAALTGLRKKGHVLISGKVDDGPRIYRVREEVCVAADGAAA
jgi:hypothetical protein